VRLPHTIAPDLPPHVEGDSYRLRQILLNLVSNAIKFTPPGGRVEVGLARAGDAVEIRVSDSGVGIRLARVDGAVEVRVSDTGAGIKPEFLPYVFDRFRQADSATTRSHGGLGLGLSIARHLVELHGGTIAADSEGPGRGSVFTITLPAGPEPAPEGRGARAAEEGSAPLWTGGGALAGVRVLVVEDEADTRELLARMLARCGAEVSEAGSVAHAMAALDAMSANGTGRLPHVLVSDIGMPQEDGFALLARLRERGPERGGAIPALALTAYARGEDRQRALAAGFAAHLAKPVEPQDLVEAVARLARAAG